jgi:hypothetical protein
LLCGTGTAGFYQAGVLRALAEAGIKIDVVAGHGPGVANALCAAIDGDSRLWDDAGPWSGGGLGRAYRWRAALRVAAMGLWLAIALLSVAVIDSASSRRCRTARVWSPASLSLPNAPAWLMSLYQRLIEFLFTPPILPTVMPRAVVLALVLVVIVLCLAAWRAVFRDGSRRSVRGAFWWRLLGAPLTPEEPAHTLTAALWKLVRGASGAQMPDHAELSRRYVDVLAENLGQPGFREVVVAVHDIDSRGI